MKKYEITFLIIGGRTTPRSFARTHHIFRWFSKILELFYYTIENSTVKEKLDIDGNLSADTDPIIEQSRGCLGVINWFPDQENSQLEINCQASPYFQRMSQIHELFHQFLSMFWASLLSRNENLLQSCMFSRVSCFRVEKNSQNGRDRCETPILYQ